MTSIARTFAVSLGIVATAIFLILLGIVVWRYYTHARDASCHVAAAILGRATVVNGRTLTIRPTSALEELKSGSPQLWYVVSAGDLVDEFGPERRPTLPFAFPYTGPAGFAAFNTLDRNRTVCLSVVQRGALQLTMMIADPQPRFGQEIATFISRNVFPFALLALGFATIVGIGAMLAARFVSRSIERVTRLALAIDPAAPQGLISLSQVPRELKPLVEALNRAFSEIDAYIKMQRRFLGNAAHQLRTPLTLLRAKIEEVPEPSLKAALVSDVRRLTSLVSAMLDLARLQNHVIEKRPIDLSVVVLETLADFSPSALDSDIELALEQAEDGPFIVQGVEAAIRSALANLVGNALIHARGAQRVTATLSRGGVSIHDDGAGFPSGAEHKLIEPFQTGNGASAGAGLGLSIVREIMAAHGGELVINSRAGQGTTMYLRFPCSEHQDTSAHAPNSSNKNVQHVVAHLKESLS
ncbi:HAMP domain-containing histidine kinase [Bradyrhizobium lablabi]|uniref:sensor histidine kinase n=1 Tax=Bradyrhizobium lablabi TaxID=722472 RepID=UPI001BA51B5D|nr:HAMP domain-containing sensor histidine kinase [Bradyrhizobium lablabi]MBR1125666.1 HAMP domain-containing histidine kinase [Bradyrhizobium lablabi]